MNRTTLQNSIGVLKTVYMVVAGLALAVGLDRLVLSDNGQFKLEWATLSFVFFLIFITTVVRFVHGAMRHFDQSYVEQPYLVNWRILQPLWDFLFLGFEAFIFFILAFSLDHPFRFIQYYLWLLIMDTLWLCITSPPPLKRILTGHCKWWIVANAFVLVPTGGLILWFFFQGIEIYPPWLQWVFISGVAIHTIMDYPLNWEFYFGRSLRGQPRVEILFIAGSYWSSDSNEIEQNVRLAERHSIELWNRGYKVFCPHLNTKHFELKAKVDEKAYRDFDIQMLQSCDAVFALPNWQDSAGAKAEIEEAKRLGKPVFYSLDELPARK